MTNVSDLTVEVLKDIREEMREMRGDLRTLTESVDTGFAAVNQRIDTAIKIVGTHHRELESRVKRIEDHLGLPPEH